MKYFTLFFALFLFAFHPSTQAQPDDNGWEIKSYGGYQALYHWDVDRRHQLAIIKTGENTVNMAVFVGTHDFYEFTHPEYRWEKSLIKPVENYLSIQDEGFSMLDKDGTRTQYWLERLKRESYVMFKFRTNHKQEEYAMFVLEGAEAAVNKLLGKKTTKVTDYRYGKRVESVSR